MFFITCYSAVSKIQMSSTYSTDRLCVWFIPGTGTVIAQVTEPIHAFTRLYHLRNGSTCYWNMITHFYSRNVYSHHTSDRASVSFNKAPSLVQWQHLLLEYDNIFCLFKNAYSQYISDRAPVSFNEAPSLVQWQHLLLEYDNIFYLLKNAYSHRTSDRVSISLYKAPSLVQ